MTYYGIEILSTEEEMKKALISMTLGNLPLLPTNADIHQYIIYSLAFFGIKAQKESSSFPMPKTIPLSKVNEGILVMNCGDGKLYARNDDELNELMEKEGK